MIYKLLIGDVKESLYNGPVKTGHDGSMVFPYLVPGRNFSMIQLTLLRHGTTQWMETGFIHGQLDSPLSKKGIQEVGLAADWLKAQPFDILFTSPLGRTLQTANIVSAEIGLAPIPLDDLKERHLGALEGRQWDGPAGKPGALNFPPLRFLLFLLTGEPGRKFSRRVREAYARMAAMQPQGRILCVTHAGVIGVMLRNLLGKGVPWRDYRVDPASLSQVEISDSGTVRLNFKNFTDQRNP
jgi:broad specificity phosphatase PhoE